MSEISKLIAKLHNADEKEQAARSLKEMGRAALPSVLAVLDDKSEPPEVRTTVTNIIRRMGDQGLPAAENLAKCAADNANALQLRKMALFALGDMGLGALALRPLLDAILKDDTTDYRIRTSVNVAIEKITGGRIFEKF